MWVLVAAGWTGALGLGVLGRDRGESEGLASTGVTEPRSRRARSSEQGGEAGAAEGGAVPGGEEAESGWGRAGARRVLRPREGAGRGEGAGEGRAGCTGRPAVSAGHGTGRPRWPVLRGPRARSSVHRSAGPRSVRLLYRQEASADAELWPRTAAPWRREETQPARRPGWFQSPRSRTRSQPWLTVLGGARWWERPAPCPRRPPHDSECPTQLQSPPGHRSPLRGQGGSGWAAPVHLG